MADRLALGYAVGALVAGIAYCALFLLLAVVTRHAVVVGLLYALIWESLVGNFVPGAQALSIQQWSLVFTEKVVGTSRSAELDIDPAVGLGAAIPLLLVVGSRLHLVRRLSGCARCGCPATSRVYGSPAWPPTSG